MSIFKEYKPFLIQKMTDGAEVRGSEDWNIYVKHVPFQPVGNLKEPFTRDWPDRNGKEVYYPATPVYESYDMECEFAYKGDENTATPMTRLFIHYLAEGGMFKFFDTFNQIGRQSVYYKSFTPDKYYNTVENMATFKVVMSVNDPDTQITLTKQATT